MNKLSTQFNLIYTGLILLVAAAMILFWYMNRMNVTEINKITESYINQINKTVTQKAITYLEPAPIMTELASKVTGDDVRFLSNNKYLEKLLKQIIYLHPQFNRAYIGNEEGDFLMQKKMPNNKIETKIIDRKAGKILDYQTKYYLENNLIESQKNVDDNYDPRVRPWYKGVKKSNKPIWTDLYIFYSDKKHGVSASYPVFDNNRNFAGAISLDIPLGELSIFLRNQKVGKTGIIFITNHLGELVAYPDPSVPVIKDVKGFRPRLISELNQKEVQLAYHHFLKNQQQKFVITVDGTRYISSFQPINLHFTEKGKEWRLGLVVPENDFIGAIQNANDKMLLFSMGVLLIAIIFTFILYHIKKALKLRNIVIRKTFGRYLSDDIVATILASPKENLLQVDKRVLTILMTDLRGFTSLTEQMPAEDVVNIINIYLEEMTEIILKYQGTIDEFIGDAILTIFGAPLQRDDDAKRAVACALEMQLAMDKVNQRCRENGYPEVYQGIGINTGLAVVGNIGSLKRTKYGVTGSNVNLTSRIESYTVGGQILISESTKNACENLLRIDNQFQVSPKGVKKPITIYEVGGIAGQYNVNLPEKKELKMKPLKEIIPLEFIPLSGKHVSEEHWKGTIQSICGSIVDIHTEHLLEPLTNLKIALYYTNNKLVSDEVYGKITQVISQSPVILRVNLSYVPVDARQFIHHLNSL